MLECSLDMLPPDMKKGGIPGCFAVLITFSDYEICKMRDKSPRI